MGYDLVVYSNRNLEEDENIYNDILFEGREELEHNEGEESKDENTSKIRSTPLWKYVTKLEEQGVEPLNFYAIMYVNTTNLTMDHILM